jgi:hypothetical protein
MHIFISKPYVGFAFPKDSNFILKSFSELFKKPWLEFEYSKKFSKVPDSKIL